MPPDPARPNGPPAAAGYSGTPLPKKLGLGGQTRLLVIGEPPDYDRLLGPVPAGLQRQRRLSPATNLVHLFVTERADLARQLGRLRSRLDPAVPVWVSWPKKSSRVATDVTEDTIRELALPLGFVDVKVCAVNEVWSALKLSVRRALRGATPVLAIAALATALGTGLVPGAARAQAEAASAATPPARAASRPRMPWDCTVPPPLPAAALREGIAGAVDVEIVFNEDGSKRSASVVRSSGETRVHRLLDRTALTYAVDCTRRPADAQTGVPYRVSFRWRLE